MSAILEKTDSTQAELKRRLLLDPHLPNFYYVQALEQSDGRGRQGRVWNSVRGNLHLSVLLRGPIERVTWISHRVALAIIQTLEQIGIEENLLRIKWPNDIVIAPNTTDVPKKISGILIEQVGEHYIIGIGADVMSAPIVDDQLTACVLDYVSHVSLENVKDRLLQNIQGVFTNQDFESLKNNYCKYSYFRGGETVRWGSEQGVFANYGEYGEMLVRLGDQQTKALFSEDVHLRND